MERSFRSRNVDVFIRESDDRVEVTLDGQPIDVEKIDGEYHSQLANQFVGFKTLDELVDTLLHNEGRVWSLSGDIGSPGGHRHGGGAGGDEEGHGPRHR
jgi:hypothetical protein